MAEAKQGEYKRERRGRTKRPARPSDLDSLIHERLRLGIVSVLSVRDEISFTELRTLLGATDGNLSVQARRLEQAGYVRCTKTFEKRRPKTVFKLTRQGRKALEDYLQTLARLLPPASPVSAAARTTATEDGQAAAQPA